MEALIRFGYDVIGSTKIAAFVILLFVVLFRSIKNRMDKSREDKSSRISEFIAELEKSPSPKYEYVVEQTFQDRYGVLVDYPIIKFFLRSKTPSTDMLDFTIGKRYLEFDGSYRKISYKKKYTTRKLKAKNFIMSVTGLLSIYIAILLVIVLPKAPFDGSTEFAVYLLLTLCTFMWGYLSLDETGRPTSAIKLYKKYNKDIN